MTRDREQQSAGETAAGPIWLQHSLELLAQLPDGILILDRSGRVVFGNPASTRMLGIPDAVLVGRRYDDEEVLGQAKPVGPSAAGGADTDAVARALESAEAVYSRHVTVDRAATGRSYFALDVIPLHSAMGGLAGVAVVIGDETDALSLRSEGEWLRRELLSSRRQVEEMLRFSQALNEIGEAIHSTLDFDEVLRRVVSTAVRGASADVGVIAMRESAGWLVRAAAGLSSDVEGRRFSDEQARGPAMAAETRQPVVIADSEHEGAASPIAEEAGARSSLVVPLLGRNEVVGTLSLHCLSLAVFSPQQIAFASRLASMTSLAMENARVYAEERHIADTLQQALVAVPEAVQGLEYEHLYQSATEAAWVGGDFFDVFELPGHRVGIVIGDVSGKGVEASALASFTRQLLKAHAQEDLSPARVIARTNDLVNHVSLPQDFVTVFFGILSTPDGTLTFSSAGHPPPVLNRRGRSELLADGGPILGAFTDVAYDEQELRIESGDLLVLYTDGVIEAKGDGELFGDERLLALVDSLDAADLREVTETMLREVSAFAGGHLRDDLALLCLRLPDRS